MSAYTIGVDFGTNSVRAVVVDTANGHVVGTRVFDYPSGEQGVLLDARQPHLARQNPADYIEGLRVAVSGALHEAEGDRTFARERVVKLGEIVGNDYAVLDGLQPGDHLIVSGTQFLQDGAPVSEQMETPGTQNKSGSAPKTGN